MVPTLFSLVIIIGFLGNLLVVLVVILNKKIRTTANILIFNIAVSVINLYVKCYLDLQLSDLLFILQCIPFTLASVWPFGDFWCSSVQYLIIVTVLVSIYTLILMSFDS